MLSKVLNAAHGSEVEWFTTADIYLDFGNIAVHCTTPSNALQSDYPYLGFTLELHGDTE